MGNKETPKYETIEVNKTVWFIPATPTADTEHRCYYCDTSQFNNGDFELPTLSDAKELILSKKLNDLKANPRGSFADGEFFLCWVDGGYALVQTDLKDRSSLFVKKNACGLGIPMPVWLVKHIQDEPAL